MNDSHFTGRIFYRFFIPSLISSLCFSIANMVDALCVGMLLGEPALAAIDLVSPIYMIYNVLDVGMGVGGSVVFTRLLSDGRSGKAVSVFRQMFMAALGVSVLLSALGVAFLRPVLFVLGTNPAHGAVYEMARDYALRLFLGAPLFFLNLLFYHFVRCDDGEKLASLALGAANVLDVGLTVVLVLGFNMGVKGAIYATLIGTGTGVLLYLPHFLNRARLLRPGFERPESSTMLRCLRTGFSSSSQYIFQFFSFLIINNLLMYRYDARALAVFNVVLNISYVATGLYDSVAGSIQPMAATFFGERNEPAQRLSRRLGLKWGLLAGGALMAAIAAFAPAIAALFGLSDDTLAVGAFALRCYCAGMPLLGVSMISGAYWQAVGQERLTMRLTFLRSFLIYLLLAVPLSFGPLRLYWLLFPGTELLSLAVFLALRRLSARREQTDEAHGSPVLHALIRESGQQFSDLLAQVEDFCGGQEASVTQSMLVSMAVEEMCAAIFRHARIGQDFYIQITLFRGEDDLFELHIRDSGSPFDPFSLRMGRIDEMENEDEAMDSMGIYLVKQEAKECSYRHYQGFNTLIVRI